MKKAEKSAKANPQQENPPVVEEESTGRKILNTVVNVILVVAIVLAALCTYLSYDSSEAGSGVPSIFGVRMFSILTDSMYDTLLPGDLIISTVVDNPDELRVGDIITYWTVINGERVLNTHRINQVFDGDGFLIFETKGDKNTAADALTVHEAEVVGLYAFRIPGLGLAFDFMKTDTGFLIIVVLPVFVFFLYHLVQFFRVLFEYQNVKNRIKYEQERGRTEDLIAEQRRAAEEEAARRALMEAELREKLRAEILASMAAQSAPPVTQPTGAETPAPGSIQPDESPVEDAAEE